MTENLPTHVRQTTRDLPSSPEFEILPAQSGADWPRPINNQGVYAQPVLPLDRYASVCMQVREATILASEDPAAFNSAFTQTVQQPLRQSVGNGKKRSEFPIGQLAAWICVTQLGAIIWILTGGPLHIDGLGRLRDSIWLAASPALGCLSHNGIFELVPETVPASQATKSTAKVAGKKTHSKSRHQNKGSVAKRDQQWAPAAGFIPPPPPNIPTSALLVPPPPVAYSLFSKGPGAAAASTLPVLDAQPPLESMPTAKSIATVTKHETSTKAVAAVSDAPKKASNVEHTAARSDGHASTKVPAVTAEDLPLPLAQSLNAAAMLPPAAEQQVPSPAVNAPTTPSPSYTVMSGNRKRVITDR